MTKPLQNEAPPNQIQLTLEGHIIEGQTLDTSGHDIRVTIISGGTSKNGYHYDDAALHQVVRMMEGAHAYADHSRSSADLATRSVRDVVGFYHDAQFVASSAGQPARVDASKCHRRSRQQCQPAKHHKFRC